jgi:AraC-like DNA-binding protein
MSAGHLSRQFRLAYGESPYGYLMTRRIERAMALLRRGDLSVTEVCFAVGCSSLGTFSSRFTELVGMPPSVYRRQAARGDGGDAVVRGEAGDQTDQESRSADPRAAASVTAMDTTIHALDHGRPCRPARHVHRPGAPAADPGITDDERRTIVELAGHSDRDDAERDGRRASLFIAGVRRPLRGSLASSVLATVRSLSSPEVKRLGLVRRQEVLRNG